MEEVPERGHVLRRRRARHGRRRDGQARDPGHPGGRRQPSRHDPRPGGAARRPDAEVESAAGASATSGSTTSSMDEDEYRAIQADPRPSSGCSFASRPSVWRAGSTSPRTRLAVRRDPVYVTGGNDDLTEVMATLDRPDTQLVRRPARTGRVATRRRARDDQPCRTSTRRRGRPRARRPRSGAGREDRRTGRGARRDPSKAIFNFHAPPADSTLDTCPMLDATTDPPSQVVRGGQPVMYGAGSTAIRDALERYQPLLGLHGHIHESQAAARMGPTLCDQPGKRVRRGRPARLPHHDRRREGEELPDDRRLSGPRGSDRDEGGDRRGSGSGIPTRLPNPVAR